MRRSRYLVFSSAGDRNNIDSWLSQPGRRDFDVAVHYFGDKDDPGLEVDFLTRRKGLKFQNFHDFVETGGLHGYDAVWVVDDDIIMDTESINRMFHLFAGHDLWLAQPSFDRQSRRPWQHTFADPDYVLRYTNFVENGVALFATVVVDRLMPTFRDAGTGFGVDFLWPCLLDFPRDRIAVIDAVSCIHPNEHPSSLNEVVPRPLHMIQGTDLLIGYGLLPPETDVSDGIFVKPYDVEVYGGVAVGEP